MVQRKQNRSLVLDSGLSAMAKLSAELQLLELRVSKLERNTLVSAYTPQGIETHSDHFPYFPNPRAGR